MNHTTSMETPIIDATILDQQRKIIAALQLEVLLRIQGGVQYRRELESVGFAIDLLDRLSHSDSQNEPLRGHCY